MFLLLKLRMVSVYYDAGSFIDYKQLIVSNIIILGLFWSCGCLFSLRELATLVASLSEHESSLTRKYARHLHLLWNINCRLSSQITEPNSRETSHFPSTSDSSSQRNPLQTAVICYEDGSQVNKDKQPYHFLKHTPLIMLSLSEYMIHTL